MKTLNTILATFYKKTQYYFGNILQKNPMPLRQHFIKNPKLLGKQLVYQSPNIISQKYYIMLKAQN